MSGFDTTPKPAFLRAMQAQTWSVSGAIAELVDNGFGSGRGNAKRVHITHDPKRRTISVLDNGRGMEAIGRLFQLGNTIGRSPGDIGVYGSGGTMAVLWLARRVEVWTLADGMVSHDSVDWTKTIKADEFPAISDEWTTATVRNTPSELLDARHGTLIHLHLAPERRFVPSNARRDLAATYAPALRQGRELLWTTSGTQGETSTLGDLVLMPDDPARTTLFDVVVEVDGQHLTVQGTVGIVEGLGLSKSKIAVGYGHRVIVKTRDCFVSPDRSEKYVGAGIAGWLDLGEGWQPYLSTTKDGINDRRAWDALMEHVFGKIRPLLKQVDTDEIRVEFDNLALNLEKALDGLSKVRVHVARTEEEGEGILGTGYSPGPNPREKVQHSEVERSENPEDPEAGAPSAAQIIITRQNDAGMEQELCQAELLGGGDISVCVNEDHPAIQEALRSEPTNRLMLNMAATREIAAEIASKPEIKRRLFSRSVLTVLDDKDEVGQARHIHRLLMDNVRGRPTEEAAS